MANESSVQNFVHKLEEGGWARMIQAAVMIALMVAVSVYLIISRFNGLSTATGMEQAQIAREIARGHGFSTKFIRPVEVQPLIDRHGSFPAGNIPETYQAPLYPAFNAALLYFTKSHWKIAESNLVYLPDRLIAIGALFWLAVGLGISFFTLRRLFDVKVASLTIGLCFVSTTFWEESLTGLPQMFMFALFSAAVYCLVRAVENHTESRTATGWLALAGVAFGLLALAHALTIWLFVGAVVFSAMVFRPKLRDTAVMVVIFLVLYTPWLVRNYTVSGSTVGSSIYTLMYQANGEVDAVMRTSDQRITNLSLGGLRRKAQNQAIGQFDNIYGNLGHIVVAPVFFVALLHLFKRRDTSLMRWAVFLMWLAGVAGMSLFGVDVGDPGVNDLHLLFIPLATAYGLAFVLVLWNRLNLHIPLARTVFIIAIYAVSAVPFAIYLLGSSFAVQWPPYVAPFIGKLGDWTEPDEVIASDMPWAVAWYADRKSVWMPQTPDELVQMKDWNTLKAPIVGLYLTPITGDKRFISDIAKGDLKEWAPLVMRTTAFPPGWPFQAAIPMPINNETIFYADRDRWTGTAPEN